MRLVRLFSALLFSFLAAACADLPTSTADRDDAKIAPGASGPSQALDPLVVVGTCDPYLSLDRCGQEEDCMTSTDVAPALGDFSTLSGCSTGGGGSGDGGGTGGGGGSGGGSTAPAPIPPLPTYEGPGAFAACIAGILVLAGTTAMMQPYAESLYAARNEYDSARRMYSAVMANSPSLEMELLYEHRVAAAKSNYDNAVQGYTGAAGVSVLAVIAAVGVCSPTLILPTP